MLEHTFHRFGPFVIVRTLGRGGMGEVFIARTAWDDKPVAAVKRLRPDVARVPTFADRFKHEAELAVRLEHPNVVGTLDVGSVEGQLYVCSELVFGKDTGVIADRLRERGQGGPAAVAIRLLLDTLAGLAYVHNAREPDGRPLMLVHRDVTPGNLLVGYDGVAKLADFGLAKSLLTERSKLTVQGEILGTPHYLAPEIIRGEAASPASDLYGLGAVMYRFLTGVAPHQGTTAEVLLKVLSEQPRPLSDLRPDLQPWLVAFVHRLLETDPSRRPADAAQLLKQLTYDARASGLLVPRAAVGRWIGALFEAEKAEELEERDRIVAIEPDSVPEKPEGTVVLAHPRAASRLEAPPSLAPEDVDSQGTELELSESELRSARAPEVSARPQSMKRRPAADAADFQVPLNPSEVTDALAQRVNFDALSFEDDSIHGMPTRAVTVYTGALAGAKAEKATIEAERPPGVAPFIADRAHPDPAATSLKNKAPVTDAETTGPEGPVERARAAALAASIDQDSADTHLPGFIDEAPRRRPQEIVPPTATTPDRSSAEDEAFKARRLNVNPRDLEVVPVRPMMNEPSRSGEGPRVLPGPELPPTLARPAPKPKGANGEAARSAKRSGRDSDAQVRALPEAERKKDSASRAVAAPRGAPRPPDSSVARNLVMLAALLIVAIAMGIGIGILVASFRQRVENPAEVLEQRLVRATTEMEARRRKGDVVPQRAWELTVSAMMALKQGRAVPAQRDIEEVERLLAGGAAESPAPAPAPAPAPPPAQVEPAVH